jgi:signal transduction histidine kinase
MALGIFYAFAIIQMLRVLGVFPNNWLTNYAIEIGLIFQSLFHFASMDALVREEFKEKELAQQQALRTLRRADEMKDQLLANTSHELRTPLHGMIGLMDMILSSTTEKLTRKTKRQLQLVAENARRLNDMVGKLLDLAALQGHRVKINMESVILHTLVEAVLNLSQALVGKKTDSPAKKDSAKFTSCFRRPKQSSADFTQFNCKCTQIHRQRKSDNFCVFSKRQAAFGSSG